MVYLLIVGMMIASGFGFPLPEEVTIVSVGILAYLGTQPGVFVPPYPGADVVHPLEAAIVTTAAVIFADALVFFIGRLGGRRLVKKKPLVYLFTEELIARINGFVKKYGLFATFLFRFTPGLRFPAHLMLGMSELKAWKFISVDGLAAVLSVPTQILLIAHYGEPILKVLYEFKIGLAVILGLLLVLLVGRRIWAFVQLRRVAS